LASEEKTGDAFEAALKRELQRAPLSDAADCPAPELLAAYYDRSLTRGQLARLDAHLTSCARCQSMMASIAHADDSDLAPDPARGIAWLVRLLAPVAVVGVVIAIMVGMRTREQHPPPEVIALAAPVVSSRLELAERAAAPFPAIAPQAPPPSKAPTAPGARGAATSQKAAPLAREAMAQKSALPLVAKSSTNQISSSDGSVGWRFGRGGTILRSSNSGPWVPMRSGVTTDLLAASAPSNAVCWIVGKSGTIVRTLDRGAHWQLVMPPTRDNFTAITATDSNNATLIAQNGTRYITHDGGVTWSSP
jgi:hypothetical protein